MSYGGTYGSPPPPPPPPPPGRAYRGPSGAQDSWLRSRWAARIVAIASIGLLLVILFRPSSGDTDASIREVTYDQFLEQVAGGEVASMDYDEEDGSVTWTADGREFETTAPTPLPAADQALLDENDVIVSEAQEEPSQLQQWLPVVAFPLVIGVVFALIRRRHAPKAPTEAGPIS